MSPAMERSLASESSTLSPLPRGLHRGLVAVSVLGYLSFISSTGLLLFIGFRLIQWKRSGKGQPLNQFVLLIFNLLLADLQQSVAFLLNSQWLVDNSITVGSATCWAQGWFVSTGDLASGVWCSAIGVHTFASVLFNYRMRPWAFYSIMISLWVFVYGCAIIGVGMHPSDIYVRAGAWCWIAEKHNAARLWLHYFWIFVAEFGTVIVYACLYMGLISRLRSNYYTPTAAKHAKQAARLMALYPAVYVCCTLPLASARMMSIAGSNPSYERLCVAGAMITSNGWLDVLVYTLTRRVSLFSHEPPPNTVGVESFTVPFFGVSQHKRFGTVTTIEGPPRQPPPQRKRSIFHHHSLSSGDHSRTDSRQSMQGSTDDLVWGNQDPFQGRNVVRRETTVQVRSAPLELDDIEAMNHMRIMEERALHVRTGSKNSKDSRQGGSLDFETKPEGFDDP